MLLPNGVFEPGQLDFGEVPVDVQRALPVVLSNVGQYKLVIEAIDTPDGFSLSGSKGALIGTEILPGESIDLEVVFLPLEERAYTGSLTVTDGELSWILQLSGAGVIRALPVLTVEPVGVDFGAVALEETGRATVQISNRGTAAGVIESASLRSTSMSLTGSETFGLATGLPITVDPGQSVPVELTFTPTLEAQISDVLVLHPANHDALEIGVTGQGIVPLGDVICTPGRVDFGAVERGSTKILPVTCEARGGPARLVGARAVGSPMFVLPSPPNTQDLTTGATATIDVEFRPDGTPSTQSGTLEVNYTGGAGAGTFTVNLVGEVIPPPVTETAMTVRLQWTSNGTDVDLHFVGPGGSYYESPGDCFYSNKEPDWGVPGDTTDNPFLDVDDQDGYGPEEINLSAAPAGRYDIYAHYYTDNDRGATDSIVEVYISGQLVATRNRGNMSCGVLWHVGFIQWDGSSGVFTAVDGTDFDFLGAGCF